MSLKPIAWSFTSLSDFENCPKAFYHKRVAKDVTEEQGDAALWGDNVHKFFEYSIMQYRGMPIEAAEATAILEGRDNEFATYKPYLEAVLSLSGDIYPERQYAIDKSLQPCDWFDKEVWCRGIIDVLVLKGDKAYALDWKTGKRKPNSRQLKLFALLVFLHHPEVQMVKTEFVWLKSNERDTETYTRAQESELWQEFVPSLARFKAAFKHEVFPPKTSGLCNGWCPVTKCEHWKPKKSR